MNDLKRTGFFIVLDGIDGCGKTTQIQRLKTYFDKISQPCKITAEPTKGPIGLLLRQYLKNNTIPAAVDALLFAADRIEHCSQEIIPALEQGYIVISDRFTDSSLIYQSVEGQSTNLSVEWLREINKFALKPDITIIIDISPELSLKRKKINLQESLNELEKFESVEFLTQVRIQFQNLPKITNSHNYCIINGNDTINNVFLSILKIINPLLLAKGIIFEFDK